MQVFDIGVINFLLRKRCFDRALLEDLVYCLAEVWVRNTVGHREDILDEVFEVQFGILEGVFGLGYFEEGDICHLI